MIHKKLPGRYEWEGVDVVTYDRPTVKGVSKRVLIRDGAVVGNANGDWQVRSTVEVDACVDPLSAEEEASRARWQPLESRAISLSGPVRSRL